MTPRKRKPKSKRSLIIGKLSMLDDRLDIGIGYKASSGERINRKTSLTYAAVWRAVNLISRDVAKLPLHVFKRDGAGRVRQPDHPAYHLLRHKASPELTAMVFRQTLQAHTLLHGNAYAYIARDAYARPLELWPLSPETTYPVRENGQLMYCTTVQGELRKLLPENVLHIRGLGFDGLVGYTVMEFARESFGMGLAMREYGSRFFANDATPSLVLQIPKPLTKEAFERLRDSWTQAQGGLTNSHKPRILEDGMEAKQLSINARDSQLLESRSFEIREIASWFGVPPHKLGDNARTAYASLEQENQAYLDDALDGWLCAWETECWDKLLTEEEKRSDDYRITFDRTAIVRADIGRRYAAYAIGRTNGWLNADEIRQAESMNPLPDGAGQVYWSPLNMGSATDGTKGLSKLIDNPPAPKAPGVGDTNVNMDDARAATRKVLVDTTRRMFRRLLKAKRGDESKHASIIEEALAPCVVTFAALRGLSLDPHALAQSLIETFASDAGSLDERQLEQIYENGAADEFVKKYEVTHA